MKLLNYAPGIAMYADRSALMTGRYPIRSGNHTIPARLQGGHRGLGAHHGRNLGKISII